VADGGGGALRVLFAELGFEIDDSALKRADALVEGAASHVKTLIAQAAGLDSLDWGAAQLERLARTEAKVAAAADERRASMSLAPDLQKEVDAVVAAEAAKKKARADVDGARFDPFQKAKKDGATSFGGKFSTLAKPAEKSVTGLMDLIGRLEKKASTAIGKTLPASFGPLFEKLGVAKGDFAAMGQIAGAATGAIVGGLTLAARSAFSFADAFSQNSEALRETAREARVTSSEMQELTHAGVAGGVGAERMASGVNTLAQSLRLAETHQSGVGWTLRRLGVQMRDSAGHVRSTADVMDDLAVGLERVQSPARRTRIAVQLFGESGRRMLDVMHSGAGGIRALRDEMAALGGGVTPEATEAARQYALAQERLSRGSDSLRSVLAVALLPRLAELVTKGAEVLGWLSRMTRGTHLVEVALVAVGLAGVAAGTALVATWLSAAAPFIVAAAGVLLVALALDDLWNFIEGNNSALGELLDSMLWVGASREIVEGIRDAWGEVEETIARVFDWLDRLPAAAQAALWPLTAIRNAARALTGDGGGGTGEEGAPASGVRGTGRGRPAVGARRGAPTQPMIPAPAAPTVVQLGLDGRPVVAAPATRAVAAPLSAGGGRARPAVVHHHAGDRIDFHLAGPNAQELAERVGAVLERRDRERRDGQHPTEDTD
jgi:hypothetical protein